MEDSILRSSILKYASLLVIIALVVIGVLFAQQQGMFPWLNNGYRINANIVLERIQDMSLLTTTRFNYSSVVTSERQMPGILGALYGERQVMVAVGYVVAGVDMSKIEGGILEEAQEQAAEVIKTFITLLGVEAIRDVSITVSMPDANAPLPNSCS
ncbi:MAG: DUF4230 domain-containing protein [Chloroflexi bacterium]|nr:DUF4230 domain-containing protein [Chloroflexota bacterium]